MAMRYVALTGKKEPATREIVVEPLEGDRYAVTIDGESREVDAFLTEEGLTMRINGKNYRIPAEVRGEQTLVRLGITEHAFELMDARTWELKSALGHGAGALKPELKSPMAGKIVMTRVAAGDEVKEGDTLVIVEAMKMENEIRAVADARIKEVRVAAGDLVNPGDVLLAFDLEAG